MKLLPLAILAACFTITAYAAEQRVWTDQKGRYQILATLVEVRDGMVHLKRDDGTIMKMPLNELSHSDQEYAQRPPELWDSPVRVKFMHGKVIAVADGDTLTILDKPGAQRRIQLEGVDSPERLQPFGTQARKTLVSKVFDKQVRVEWKSKDRYGRFVGRVYFDGRWINKEMVEEGFAWHDKANSKAPDLTAAETKAKEARKGLWAEKEPVAPWDFRNDPSKYVSSIVEENAIRDVREPAGRFVYLTKGSKYYHAEDCPQLGEHIVPSALELASQKCRACPFCLPPGASLSIAVRKPEQQAPDEKDALNEEAENKFTIDLGEGIKIEFVLVPAGSFKMGDGEGFPGEKPVHEVTITKPFYVGKYEVTQGQWKAIMGDNPSHFKGSANPVEMVAWKDCQRFLRKLNEKFGETGMRFVLPTEAQWEFACRAGSAGRFSFPEDAAGLGEYMWFNVNSENETRAVGLKRPNALGLHDMHGNVMEWCADWYSEDCYDRSPAKDPSGPVSGVGRVTRGGGWNAHACFCRSAARRKFKSAGRSRAIGFRVLCIR